MGTAPRVLHGISNIHSPLNMKGQGSSMCESSSSSFVKMVQILLGYSVVFFFFFSKFNITI